MKKVLVLLVLQSLFLSVISQSNTSSKKSNEVKARNKKYTKRNFFWYTPNKVEEINGLALGAWPENLKNNEIQEPDSLKINGLNIEINPAVLFILIRGVWTRRNPNDICYYYDQVKNKHKAKLNGANISVLGTIGSIKINGLNIGGLNTIADQINGVSICGLNNFAYEHNGVSIAVFRNRAIVAKGIQISLFNKAIDLRGFQFGLWNVNGKRSLPFINWQFKP